MSSEQQGGAGTQGRMVSSPSALQESHDGQRTTSLTPREEAEEWRKKAEGFFNSLPQPSIQPLPDEHAFDLSRYQNKPTCTPAEAWQKCAGIMEKIDADSCKAYREEIDTLLVFAGLFSAVVTAFTIESYQWLQSDPDDTIIALLSQIAQPGNETRTPPMPAGLSDSVSARINAYWFLSLTISLTAALLAILCKQWVREFERHGDQSHIQYISVRQTKLEGFERWGVAGVVGSIPLLLQSALGLFALGMIELLWQLRRAVAIVVLIPTSAALLFYAATTVLPGLQLVFSPFGVLHTLSQCPFKSPQALLALRIHVLVLDSLWCPHCDPCPRVIFYCVEFCYRKSVVLCRRVHASFRPDVMSSLRNGSETPAESQLPLRGRLQRMLQPWLCDESKFYTHQERRNLSDLQFWSCRRLGFLPFWCSQPLRSCRPLGPSRKACNSWITLDREFTRLREATVRYDAVRPTACFRGLSWLLEHTDQPSLREWIWLSVWDIALHISRKRERRKVMTQNLHDGILHLTSGEAENIAGDPIRPWNLALAYSIHAKLDPAFIGELFVHLVPRMDHSVARSLWSSPSDANILHSGLHAFLAHLLYWSRLDISPYTLPHALLSMAIQRHKTVLFTLSPQEVGCLIALQFCARRSRGEEVFDCSQDSQRLMDAAIRCLAYADSEDSPYESPELKSTFSALAVAFDRLLEHHDSEDISEFLPSHLYDNQGLRIYLYLISAAPDEHGSPSGGVPAAKARLARQLTHLLRRQEARYRGPGEPGGDTRQIRESIRCLTGHVPSPPSNPPDGLTYLQAYTPSLGEENAIHGPSGLALEPPSAPLVDGAEPGKAVRGTLATVVVAPYDAERIADISRADRNDATAAPLRPLSARTAAPRDVDSGTVISVPASSGAWDRHEPDDPTAAGLWLGASRVVAQSASDAEPGTAAHDYDGLSLLATPHRLEHEIPGAGEDAEPERTLPRASGTSSPHPGQAHESLDAVEVTNTVGASLRSQCPLDHETVSIVAASAGRETDLAPNATRTPESQALQELCSTSGGTVAFRDVDSGTAVAVPEASGALASQELDDVVASAVSPRDVDAGMQTLAAHGDGQISMQAAEAGRDTSSGSAPASGTPELGTSVSETDGGTGPGS